MFQGPVVLFDSLESVCQKVCRIIMRSQKRGEMCNVSFNHYKINHTIISINMQWRGNKSVHAQQMFSLLIKVEHAA